jgi:hypothetical protein
MTWRGIAILTCAMVMLSVGCQGRSSLWDPRTPASGEARDSQQAQARPAGVLSPDTAIVTIRRTRTAPVLLTSAQAGTVLGVVQNALEQAGPLVPESGGPRLLANLRLNERVLDIAMWTPVALRVGSRRLTDVSGILFPFTGKWRDRILIVRKGKVAATAPLGASADLTRLERIVDAGGGGE